MNTLLPRPIDQILFNELGAIYQRGGNFDLNLSNDEQQNKIYLGTYFPRSFSESYQLFSGLFSIASLQQSINQKSIINILDIGTGTGGNVIGMMQAMKECGFNSKSIKIYSVEGNENASGYFKKIVDRFNTLNKTCFVIQQEKIIFSIDNLKQQMADYLRITALKFDIITSSKFVGEFYNLPESTYPNLFQGLTETISNFLQPDGIYILLDVVAGSRDHTSSFKTKIMSDELNAYVNTTNNGLRYIYPSPCACWSSICKTKGCYIENCFKVSHSHFQNDESNVAFRIMTHRVFANQIISKRVRKENYKISRRNQCKNGIVSWIN